MIFGQSVNHASKGTSKDYKGYVRSHIHLLLTMAFRFRSKSSLTVSGARLTSPNETKQAHMSNERSTVVPKLTNSQINKFSRVYPAWIRDNSCLKNLPAIYLGVLGQVQLQPGYSLDSLHKTDKQLLAIRQQQNDYMNRFTDTGRVHQLLSASHLSNETLATIWAHVNQTFPGKLTNREVCFALALIAIFQRLEKEKSPDNTRETTTKDPFNLIKMEKKPPVPTLYPSQMRCQKHNNNMKASKSIPDVINSVQSEDLLIDIGQDSERISLAFQEKYCILTEKKDELNDLPKCFNINRAISIIDDGDRFELGFYQLIQSWSKFMIALKGIFKRSYDALSLEKISAMELLQHPTGQVFIKQLCLCYPLAHNIKFKIDELDKLRFDAGSNYLDDDLRQSQGQCLFDKNYTLQIDDLMNSINEYWAVLINLFHESGQIKFIELIMDGLNYKQSTVISKTIDELATELNGLNEPNVCSLCHTSFYLTGYNKELNPEEVELVKDQEELLTIDHHYYYHAKCANFWLNHVEPTLPFRKQSDDAILSPSQ